MKGAVIIPFLTNDHEISFVVDVPELHSHHCCTGKMDYIHWQGTKGCSYHLAVKQETQRYDCSIAVLPHVILVNVTYTCRKVNSVNARQSVLTFKRYLLTGEEIITRICPS